jgi:hypothetical protein
MADRRPLRAFDDRAARPPAPWRKVVAVVLAIVLPLALWDKRGAVVGLVALVVYGGILLVATFDHRRTMAWSSRHVALDAALIVPLTFLALAYLSDLPLGVCVAIGVVAGAVLVPVALWRHGGEAHA